MCLGIFLYASEKTLFSNQILLNSQHYCLSAVGVICSELFLSACQVGHCSDGGREGHCPFWELGDNEMHVCGGAEDEKGRAEASVGAALLGCTWGVLKEGILFYWGITYIP